MESRMSECQASTCDQKKCTTVRIQKDNVSIQGSSDYLLRTLNIYQSTGKFCDVTLLAPLYCDQLRKKKDASKSEELKLSPDESKTATKSESNMKTRSRNSTVQTNGGRTQKDDESMTVTKSESTMRTRSRNSTIETKGKTLKKEDQHLVGTEGKSTATENTKIKSNKDPVSNKSPDFASKKKTNIPTKSPKVEKENGRKVRESDFERIPAHLCVIAAGSELFYSMSHNLVTKSYAEKKIIFDNISHDHLSLCVAYLYGNSVVFGKSELSDISSAASILKIRTLEHQCKLAAMFMKDKTLKDKLENQPLQVSVPSDIESREGYSIRTKDYQSNGHSSGGQIQNMVRSFGGHMQNMVHSSCSHIQNKVHSSQLSGSHKVEDIISSPNTSNDLKDMESSTKMLHVINGDKKSTKTHQVVKVGYLQKAGDSNRINPSLKLPVGSSGQQNEKQQKILYPPISNMSVVGMLRNCSNNEENSVTSDDQNTNIYTSKAENGHPDKVLSEKVSKSEHKDANKSQLETNQMFFPPYKPKKPQNKDKYSHPDNITHISQGDKEKRDEDSKVEPKVFNKSVFETTPKSRNSVKYQVNSAEVLETTPKSRNSVKYQVNSGEQKPDIQSPSKADIIDKEKNEKISNSEKVFKPFSPAAYNYKTPVKRKNEETDGNDPKSKSKHGTCGSNKIAKQFEVNYNFKMNTLSASEDENDGNDVDNDVSDDDNVGDNDMLLPDMNSTNYTVHNDAIKKNKLNSPSSTSQNLDSAEKKSDVSSCKEKKLKGIWYSFWEKKPQPSDKHLTKKNLNPKPPPPPTSPADKQSTEKVEKPLPTWLKRELEATKRKKPLQGSTTSSTTKTSVDTENKGSFPLGNLLLPQDLASKDGRVKVENVDTSKMTPNAATLMNALANSIQLAQAQVGSGVIPNTQYYLSIPPAQLPSVFAVPLNIPVLPIAPTMQQPAPFVLLPQNFGAATNISGLQSFPNIGVGGNNFGLPNFAMPFPSQVPASSTVEDNHDDDDNDGSQPATSSLDGPTTTHSQVSSTLSRYRKIISKELLQQMRAYPGDFDNRVKKKKSKICCPEDNAGRALFHHSYSFPTKDGKENMDFIEENYGKKIRKFTSFRERTKFYLNRAKLPKKCDHCDEVFKNYRAYLYHMRMVKDKYKCCQYCGFKTVIYSALALHERRHRQEKRFQCDLCDYRACTKVEIKFHRVVHTKVKEYICEICGKAFSRSPSLRLHRLRDHGVGNRRAGNPTVYTCEHCDYKHPTRNVMRNHMISHSSVKNHPCDVCGRSYKRLQQLKRHRREVHKIKDKSSLHSLQSNIAKTIAMVESNISGVQTESVKTERIVHKYYPEIINKKSKNSNPSYDRTDSNNSEIFDNNEVVSKNKSENYLPMSSNFEPDNDDSDSGDNSDISDNCEIVQDSVEITETVPQVPTNVSTYETIHDENHVQSSSQTNRNFHPHPHGSVEQRYSNMVNEQSYVDGINETNQSFSPQKHNRERLDPDYESMYYNLQYPNQSVTVEQQPHLVREDGTVDPGDSVIVDSLEQIEAMEAAEHLNIMDNYSLSV